MCGIVGYIGKNEALPAVLDGIKKLEYRGYDSSGVAILNSSRIELIKAVGKISELEKTIAKKKIKGNMGIAHTRWATHGEPNIFNAHPHCDCTGKICLVHNGIIENYKQLKDNLILKGHRFASETDTEVIAHILEDHYKNDLLEALRQTLKILKGAYGLVAFHQDEPDRILAARCGSPLAIGIGEDEIVIASDVSAILKHTRQVVFMDDNEIAEIKQDNWRMMDFGRNGIDKKIEKIEWDLEQAEKADYPHFMLKEIFEQPQTIEASIRGRVIESEGNVKLGGLIDVEKQLKNMERLIIVACGTARNAGLVGEYMLEEFSGIPVEVDYASEFRYRKQKIDENTAVLALSQSGETADTLAAIREAKKYGALTLGIINTVGSTIARETDAGVYNHIGPEISVASTKAFTSQISILALLSVYLGRQRKMSRADGQKILNELKALPVKINQILGQNDIVKEIAREYANYDNFAFLGRKYNQPTAFEGALKLKELSYLHAEGFASGEMKHGPIAMIDENFPSIFIIPRDSVYEKNASNLEEIKARKGPVLAIATMGDERIGALADNVISIPKTLEMFTPILATIPLQLLAYHISALKGLDVDKPRNLAKSVTVE
jgi:glutamine---fructose-6-phosphate transaminase (isomerizing)